MQWLRLGYKNQAPTLKHSTHHVYEVGLYPSNTETPFILSESIGGGHAEMGGSAILSIAGLLDREGWKEHFTLSGCEWAISLIEEYKDAPLTLMDELI